MATTKDTPQIAVLDLADAIDRDVAGAAAIIDAARVLGALERASAVTPPGALATGKGYAAGVTLRDRSLPALLEVGFQLIEQIGNNARLMREGVSHE